MIGFDSIRFDTHDYKFLSSAQIRLWETPDRDRLELHYFPLKPDILAPLDDLNALRKFYRDTVSEHGRAVIEVDVVNIDDNFKGVKTLFKVPQHPTGMTYLASLTIPFRDFSFVLKVQCRETGITGMRDSAVFKQMMTDGTLSDSPLDMMSSGWFRDPYDPEITTPLMMNRSEEEAFDPMFPDHPLSRARRTQAHLIRTLKLDSLLKHRPAFQFKR
jgi:hypothetical protein